ncbi:MAG: hypothetical protein DMG06_05160 [Acidobacteria bacterium]|nr:MAG: hypothetical protein DMG06_05160 [Acidobacteriota bacterium]
MGCEKRGGKVYHPYFFVLNTPTSLGGLRQMLPNRAYVSFPLFFLAVFAVFLIAKKLHFFPKTNYNSRPG